MARSNKVMEPISANKLRAHATFEGSQVVDESTSYERYSRNWTRAAAKPGSKGTVGGGHSVKTQRRG